MIVSGICHLVFLGAVLFFASGEMPLSAEDTGDESEGGKSARLLFSGQKKGTLRTTALPRVSPTSPVPEVAITAPRRVYWDNPVEPRPSIERPVKAPTPSPEAARDWAPSRQDEEPDAQEADDAGSAARGNAPKKQAGGDDSKTDRGEADEGRGEGAGPRAVEVPQPRYPSSCIDRGHEGTAVVRVHLSRQGAILAVRVTRSTGCRSLDRAAMAAAASGRYRPATDPRGEPTFGIIEVPFRFVLP